MINKDKMPVALGVAFVWFTTQFGGGFASGAQLYQYFLAFGIWALITPILAQAMGAIFQWYGLRYARIHGTYDYRSFTDSFFGKYKFIFSNLYEVVYFVTICLAPAVAFATGGTTLSQLTGIPFFICTLIIGVVIFMLTMYGTDFVRKVASTLSVIIIVGLLVVYVPNIIVQWDAIMNSISTLSATPAPIGPALWSFFLYASFQLASIGLLTQHAEAFKDETEAKKSMIYGFLVNASIIFMCTLGMLAIALNEGIGSDPLPTLTLVRSGVGSVVLTPIISILIILGAISTAVNMVAGSVQRFTNALEKRSSPEVNEAKRKMRMTIIALIFTLLAFSIAQFGLIPLVKQGYGYLGYLTIICIVIPFIVRMIAEATGKVSK